MTRALPFLTLCLMTTLGCSATVTSTHGGPCTRSSRPATCGSPCGGSLGTCPTGYYCSATAGCYADCDYSAGVGCAEGQTCAADGHCTIDGTDGAIADAGPIITDAAPPDNTCADVMLGGTHVTPNIILLVDRSRSMNMTFDMGLSRWEVLQNAILDMPGGLVDSLQHSVRFGLAMFTGASSGGTCPDLITVLPPALDNYDAIASIYRANRPSSNTPTGESMDALVALLGGMTLPPGPTYIILATDGEPNTCASTMSGMMGQTMSEDAAGAAHAAGYTVDAIGVSTDVALANLTRVATRGGGTAYAVTSTATLVDAINTIVGGAISCDIMLSGMVDPSSACTGDVELDGMPLGCEDPNGFHVVDSTHITLQGTACDHLSHMGGVLTARFPCTAILH